MSLLVYDNTIIASYELAVAIKKFTQQGRVPIWFAKLLLQLHIVSRFSATLCNTHGARFIISDIQ